MKRIEKTIHEHTQDLSEILDFLIEDMKNKMESTTIRAGEASSMADMIKDMAEAKEKTVKSLYYTEILKAMEAGTYGRDYTEAGPMVIPGTKERLKMEYINETNQEEKRKALREYMECIAEDIKDMIPEMDLQDKQQVMTHLQILQNTL